MSNNENYMDIYQKWLEKKHEDTEITEELRAIQNDPDQIKEGFYQTIAFGTAGLRGILGAGTNRMNIYTIRRAAQGFAQAINKYGEGERKAVIAFDPRRKSDLFSRESAKIFAANGIKTYLFTEVTPTPILSYAVRALDCTGGVMITASHNPKNYNGYKVYWDDGAQVTEEKAAQIINEVNSINDYLDISTESFESYVEKEMIVMVYDEVYDKYYSELQALDYMQEGPKDISVLFSAFYGTAEKAVAKAMKNHQFVNYGVLEEQSQPNSEFPDLEYPNPEDPGSFAMLLEKAKDTNPDLLIATDPDGDRIGTQVLHQGEYVVLTGNQMGIIMVDYLLNQLPVPKEGYIVKTVVTADLSAKIAQEKGIPCYEVLTGFKYIAELAKKLEKEGKVYLFGYEESYGYMPRLFVRDKDAVQAILLLSQIAELLKKENKTLIDRLSEIYATYGYYFEENVSETYEGLAGFEKMQQIMTFLRDDFLAQSDLPVIKVQDFMGSTELDVATDQHTPIDLPSSNVLKFYLEDGSWVAVRPSGTEPKIKYYFSVIGEDQKDAEEKLQAFKNEFFRVTDTIK